MATCFFCVNMRTFYSTGYSNLIVELRKKIGTVGTSEGFSLGLWVKQTTESYRVHHITIPRCKKCTQIHDKIKFIEKICTLFICMLIIAILAVPLIYFSVSFKDILFFFLNNLFFSFIGAILLLLIFLFLKGILLKIFLDFWYRIFVSDELSKKFKTVKAFESYPLYPPVRNLLRQGYHTHEVRVEKK